MLKQIHLPMAQTRHENVNSKRSSRYVFQWRRRTAKLLSNPIPTGLISTVGATEPAPSLLRRLMVVVRRPVVDCRRRGGSCFYSSLFSRIEAWWRWLGFSVRSCREGLHDRRGLEERLAAVTGWGWRDEAAWRCGLRAADENAVGASGRL
jgi:hypothetical protein